MNSPNLRVLLSQGSTRRLFIVSIIGAAISLLLTLSHAFLIAAVVVGLIEREPNVAEKILLLGLVWIGRSTFTSSFEFWCSRQAVKIKRELRSSVTSQIQEVSAQSPSALSPSALSQTLIKGLNALDIYYGRFIPQIISASITPFAVIIVIGYIDLLSAVIALVTIPLIPLFGALIGKFTSEAVAAKWQTLGTLSGYFEDSLRGFITLRLFGRAESQHRRIQEMGDKYTAETMKVLRISFLSALALELAATLSVAVIAVTMGVRLVDSGVSFLSALTVLLLAPEVYFPLRNAATLFHASADGAEAITAISKIHESIIPRQTSHEKDFTTVTGIEWDAGRIQISPTQMAEVGAGSVRKGELLFVRGISGSGKTTFAYSLLAQRSDVPIRVLTQSNSYYLELGDQRQWLKEIGWVSQSPQFAPGTVREQFLAIDQEFHDSSIIAMLSRCDLQIVDLTDGLDTEIGGFGEKSDQVSGGQLRKIALARALAGDPVVVIADEPTADCDQISAQNVMDALRAFVHDGGLVIVITHDLSLMREEDKFMVIDQVFEDAHAYPI
jgi:ABC-type transport system involved in cytochrome bd biosynthesis fused ATPase/permease subunit